MKHPFLARSALAACFLFWLAPSLAATPTPTAEQIQMFQQLPQAQRDALLKQFQGGGARIPSPSKTPEFPQVSQPKNGEQPITAAPSIPEIPVIRGGDTLLLDFELPPITATNAINQAARARERERVSVHTQLLEQKLYTLDKTGVLDLPNVGRIPLSGLSEEDAAARIIAEPALQELKVTVKRLPVEEEIKPFGYDLFAATPTTFAPATDIPVPADYVVGPGDTVVVQLFGKDSALHELAVTREGTILFPGIGPISVAGLKFSRLQDLIARRVERQFIGMKASVTLGKLRSIQIFVLGDVERPGSYTVSGLTTLTNALLVSGGVKKIGSLRNIELKREGKTVVRFDLYDLLLKGDNSNDKNLLPNDVVFVPPVQTTVGIAGEVQRPAIYELKNEKSLSELISLAGGLSSNAFLKTVQIERVDNNRDRTIETVDLTQTDPAKVQLANGDVVRIPFVLEKMERVVQLSGHVHRPGNYQWRPNMRLADLLPSLTSLPSEVDTDYVLIKRENPETRGISLLSTSLAAAIKDPQSEANTPLEPRDTVYVFSIHNDRRAVIEPLISQVRAQASPTQPVPEATVTGTVHHPGRYPLIPKMKLSDLIAAGGGLTDKAYTLEAEITRFTVVDGVQRREEQIPIDLAAALRKEADKDVELQAYDQLIIRPIPKWDPDGVIELTGEVRFPGKYPIKRGQKLSEVLKRAGGLTEEAYPKGAIFVRESVRQREQDYLKRLASQLERELALTQVKGREIGSDQQLAVAEGEVLLEQLRSAKAAGRMVINIDALLHNNVEYDPIVENGDKLHIPQKPGEVTVVGEVYHPTSHIYRTGVSRDDFVNLSGGVTDKGDKGAIYVVHSDGSVSPTRGWFSRSPKVGPGDVIVVPLKVERVGTLKLFTDVSQILYQLAVSAAALKVLNVF